MIDHYSNKWRVFTGIALLSFGCYLDYTVVNIALPTIQKEFQVNLMQLQWVMNIYFLVLCILATIMGSFGDLFGRRRVFYVGVTIFAIASLIAGLATTIHWLIFGRLLQGIGAAAVFPLGPSLLPEAFPEKESAKAIAWLGSLGVIALALGPVLGGMIVVYWGWRWIFFINIPIILLGYLFAINSIKESTIQHITPPLDWMGMLFLTFTMGGMVMGLINSQTAGWLHYLTLTYLSVGIVSSVVFFMIERKQANPLIDFRDFSNLMFYAGTVLCFLSGILSAVALFFDPLYLQIIRAQSPELSGVILFAIPIAVFATAFIVGWLIHQFGIVNTIISSLSLAILACLLQLFFTNNTPLWYIIIAFIFLGTVWAMGNTVSLIAAQTAVSTHRRSVATGTMVTMFNIGGSIGLAVAVVIYQITGMRHLKGLLYTHAQQLNAEQFLQLKELLSNPTQSLKIQISIFIHSLFNHAFMQGFAGVMYFLLVLSILLLLSVLIFRIATR